MSKSLPLQSNTSGAKAGSYTLFGLILLQLVALILITHWYELETMLNLTELLLVSGLGFIIHSLISRPYRLYFFAILSTVILTVIAGATNMAIVLIIGSAIALIATLVKNRAVKFGLLGLIISVLIYLMAIKPSWIQPYLIALSTLGSMFVFRLSLFLYDKNYQKDRPPLIKDLSYFFMVPNMSMLLFPVVDYKLFLRNYYDDEALHIYKKGVQWIALGVFHLLVYRFIYYYILIPPVEVQDAVSFWHYATTNYLLIIRLSGLFHIAVGILCLFGFNLPRVFDNYFLASGFADLWRRINIYFRDYVVRLFYYPVFFKLRKWGDLNAKVITILFIFAMTWFLHSFQWFWLRGFFPIRMVDAVFWGVFGIFVAGNAIWESKRKRRRPNTKSWGYALTTTAQIIGMFLFMSVLWSIWSAPTMGDWSAIASQSLNSTPIQWLYILFGVVGLWILGSATYKIFEQNKWGKVLDPNPKSGLASAWSMGMIGLLLLLNWTPVQNTAERILSTDLEGLLSHKLNQADEYLLVEGYYEEILMGNELTNPVADMQENHGRRFRDTEAAKPVEDMRNIIIHPNVSTSFKEKEFTTNQWGMRDRDYELKPDENTIRIGFTGGSFVVGSGVADDEVFDRILEDLFLQRSDGYNYEILNFGSSGFDLIQCIFDFEKRELHKFELDYLIYASHGVDLHKNVRSLLTAYNHEYDIPYDFMNEVIKKSGINRNMPEREQMRLLSKHDRELIEESYTYFYNMCINHNIQPVWFYWPTIASFMDQSYLLETYASQLGMKTLNLGEVFSNHHHNELTVSATDRHPNALGHRLVAESLFEKIQEKISLKKNPLQENQ
jgi:hypothetical protein